MNRRPGAGGGDEASSGAPEARSGGDGPGELAPDGLAGRLTTRSFGRAHAHFPLCGSTNDELAAWAREGAPEGAIVTADAQSSGRGRHGRAWHSPPGVNLHVSVLLRPDRPALEIPPLTLLAGGALARTVRRLGIDARLKWPNDLLIPGRGADGSTELGGARKVAGILTEAATDGERVAQVIVGIGVNVNLDTRRAEVPPELAERATSLAQVLGQPVSRAHLLAQLLADLESAYDAFRARGNPAAIELWQAHAWLGQRYRARGPWGDVEGLTAGVGPAGELLLEDHYGIIHRVISGELTPLP